MTKILHSVAGAANHVISKVFICDICCVVLVVVRRQSKRKGAMFRELVVCCVICFVSCQTRLNLTISDVEISGTTVRVSKLVTNSSIAVSEVELATDSTQDVSLNLISTEDFNLTDRHCPRGSSKPCVVKCCPVGESIGESKNCEPSPLKFNVSFFGEATAGDGDYDYIIGNPCRFER